MMNRRAPANPATSASMLCPPGIWIWHWLPTGIRSPTASITSPDTLVNRPLVAIGVAQLTARRQSARYSRRRTVRAIILGTPVGRGRVCGCRAGLQGARAWLLPLERLYSHGLPLAGTRRHGDPMQRGATLPDGSTVVQSNSLRLWLAM